MPDAISPPLERYTWAFIDPDGNTVACPPGVTTIEIKFFSYPPGPGDGCANFPNAVVKNEGTFPCEAGEARIQPQGTPRIDVLRDDGRVYARFVENEIVGHHVDVVTERGFVNLSWVFYNSTTMMSRWCQANQAVDTTWLGKFSWLPCQQFAPASTVLPGQPAGDYMFDVWVTGTIERCGVVSEKQTVSAAVQPGQTTDVSVQFSTNL